MFKWHIHLVLKRGLRQTFYNNFIDCNRRKATKYLMFEKSIKPFETNRDRFILEWMIFKNLGNFYSYSFIYVILSVMDRACRIS